MSRSSIVFEPLRPRFCDQLRAIYIYHVMTLSRIRQMARKETRTVPHGVALLLLRLADADSSYGFDLVLVMAQHTCRHRRVIRRNRKPKTKPHIVRHGTCIDVSEPPNTYEHV